MPAGLTLIVPYYRQPVMLDRQIREWNRYPAELQIVLVDDGSPEPAVDRTLSVGGHPISLYRIDVDIPWNRNGARNLGAHVATTEWIMQVDIDHIMPANAMTELMLWLPAAHDDWYRFRRFRIGMADETRNKDSIPRDAECGEIKPHIDSYLMRRKKYLELGGYDERYAGCLGGGGVFLKRAVEALGTPHVLAFPLDVYTRSVVPDSSEHTLSRDTAEYGRRKRAFGHLKPIKPLNFPWHRVI
jgi:hypothetical protein